MQILKQDKEFKISVGSERPSNIQLGYLERGMATIKGKAEKGRPIGGICTFPNYTKAWGRRIIRDEQGKITESKNDIDVTNPNYKGEVEWLPYGDIKGCDIYARWISGQRSLDYLYQTNRLRLPTIDEDETNSYLSFPYGINVLFPSLDQALCEMMLIHYMNEDSVFKSPNSEGQMYREVKIFDTTKEEVKAMDKSFEAYTLVRNANTIAKLEVLKNVVGNAVEIIYSKADENSLYDALTLYSKNQGEQFMNAVDTYKRKVSDSIELVKVFKSFDTTKDGVIVIGTQKREILLENVPAKGEDMIQWMFENWTEPHIFEAIDKLILFSTKLK